jgi:ribosomal protein S18 acetylase RimI-like enzyme
MMEKIFNQAIQNPVQDNPVFFKNLSIEDLADIAALEVSVWPAHLRASRAKLEQRLHWGHVMLGAFMSNQLIGVAAWRYGQFDPTTALPESFDAFANRPISTPYNAAYVYNFAIAPSLRNTRPGFELALKLIAEGIKILIKDGCTYLVGASRCPSYAGSKEALNSCNQSIDLRTAIDNYQPHGLKPLDTSLPWQHDPVLSFYKHALDCAYIQILPVFMPEDKASGGYAIGFYKRLGQDS